MSSSNVVDIGMIVKRVFEDTNIKSNISIWIFTLE